MRVYQQKRRYADKVAARRGYREKARQRKRDLVAYKSGRCVDCKRKFHPCVFHFDHRDPHEKSFCISEKYGLSLETLKKEADKCDMVCANCHAKRTYDNEVVNEVVRAGRMASPDCVYTPPYDGDARPSRMRGQMSLFAVKPQTPAQQRVREFAVLKLYETYRGTAEGSAEREEAYNALMDGLD
jgi:hypothetical protein